MFEMAERGGQKLEKRRDYKGGRNLVIEFIPPPEDVTFMQVEHETKLTSCMRF